MPNNWRRRSLRLAGFDYSQPGGYFVTIVTQDRQSLFGQVVDAEMRLNNAGRVMQDTWLRLPDRFPSVAIDQFIVMPNHLHGILMLEADVVPVGAPLVGALSETQDPSAPHSLGDIVGAFKSITTFEYIRGVKEAEWEPFQTRLWQRNYYEHIIRNELALEQIREYIAANPASWEVDPEHPDSAGNFKQGQPQGLPLQEPWMV